MISKIVIPLFYLFVLVVSKEQELESKAVKIAKGNNASILESLFTKNNKNEQSDEKVKIQLYYESLCPFCRDFCTESFMFTVIELRSHLDLHVYPYGNAWVENGTINCQHGPEECYGNKLHACAIDYLDDLLWAVIYNGCLMKGSDSSEGSDDAAADQCGKKMGIDSEPIKECAKGPKGEELLKYYGDESKKVKYEGVPTVFINGVPGYATDFKKHVCNSFENKPKPCKR